jgi:L-alanine-DL-glutamate epimerase-like enolase superfamily enzyme
MAGTISAVAVRVFETPLKRPFVTSLGRKTVTVNAGITLRLSNGAEGYGEASTSLAQAHLTPDSIRKTLESLGKRARGADAQAHRELIEDAWRRAWPVQPAAAAFECALLEAYAASRGLSLSRWFGGKRKRLETDITLSAWDDPADTEKAAREAKGEGFRVFKIKVGGDHAANMARVSAARKALPKAPLILDGNQGMTPASALRLVEDCLKTGADVRLLEQPLPKADYGKMAALTKRCPVPIALDESCQTPEDARRIVEDGAAKAINIKVAKSGLLRSLEIAAVARAAGLKLMIGCMTETGAGLSASVHLALGTGFFEFADLDSDHLLAGPQKRRGWTRRGAVVSIKNR